MLEETINSYQVITFLEETILIKPKWLAYVTTNVSQNIIHVWIEYECRNVFIFKVKSGNNYQVAVKSTLSSTY